MNEQDFSLFLKQSFEDKQLSRNEASTLRQMLQEAAPTAQQIQRLRDQSFAYAQEALRHPHDRDILGWLSDVIKILLQYTPPATTTQEDEALFFPDSRSYKRLIDLLSSIQRSLDICVFTITDNRLTDLILKAHRSGVFVRILSDDDKSLDKGSEIEDLRLAGIPLSLDNKADHMHHKFAILDGHTLLNGSYNWTRSASLHNHENLTISKSPALVRAFQKEFDHLWALYSTH